MAAPANSVLIVTLPPILGGVTNQARLVAELLQRRGYAPTLAWRAYFSDRPELSVPSWRLGRGRPDVAAVDGAPWPQLAVGSWLPEFEWAHHRAWSPWDRVIDSHRHHIVVSGNNLPGFGLVERGVPSLQWIASGYRADRVDRFRTLSLPRRVFDALLNRPVTLAQERRILENADTLAISNYTLNALRDLAPRHRVRGRILIPVDTGRFRPEGRPSAAGRRLRIGTTGRMSDPRKNCELLIAAFRQVAQQRNDVDLSIRCDLDRPAFDARFGTADLGERLQVGLPLPFAELSDFYRSLDVFAISSWQEGLSVTGTEAMACGATVVSTRCGGPEEFVHDGQTGLMSGFHPVDHATRLLEALDDAAGPRRLSSAGIELVRERFAMTVFEESFLYHFAALHR